MHFIFESFFVGFYTFAIFVCIRILVTDFSILLFITGFFKHLLGYVLQIHTYYCNHGYACQRIMPLEPPVNKTRYIKNYGQIIGESIMEGFVFIMIGIMYNKYYTNVTANSVYFMIFLSGVSLHVLAEIFGIHYMFCKTQCVRIIR